MKLHKVLLLLLFFVSSEYCFSNIPDSAVQQIKQHYDLEYPARYDRIVDELRTLRPSHEMVYHFMKIELEHAEKTSPNSLSMVKVLSLMANNEMNFQKYDAAAAKLTRGIKIVQEYGDNSEKWQIQLGRLYFYMSRIYFYEYTTQQALDEILKGVPIFESTKDTISMLKSYAQIGEYLAELDQPAAALKYHDKVAVLADQIPYNSSIGHSNLGRVNCLIALHKYQEAKTFLNSIIHLTKIHRPKNTYMFEGKRAQIEMLLGNHLASRQIFEPIVDDIHSTDSVSNIFQQMAIVSNYITLLKLDKDFKTASIFQDTLFDMSRRELKMLNKNQIAEAQVKFKTLEDEKRIQELESEQTIAKSNKRSLLFGFGGLLFAIFGGFYFWNYHNQQKHKQLVLLTAKEKETQAIREKLLTSITHELRTPLSIISGKLELLSQEELKTSQKKTLETARRNTSQLVEQINQLLEWNKLEANALQNNPTVGNAEQVLEQIIEKLKPIASHKNISWNLGVTNQEYLGKLDFTKFKTIINNLISNAIKYTPHGSNIYIKLYQEKSNLVCSVQDNGPGISPEQLPFIFDWYYRVANHDSKDQFEGFGIGLALSKELAELMNGQLTVQSELNNGSIFSLKLPFNSLKSKDSQATTPALPSAANPEGPKSSSDETTLLIVEDHPELAEHVASLFRENFRVLIAADLEKASFLSEKEVPDLIICDLMLPDGSGLDFCKQLKSQMITNHIPIIMLTARTDDSSRLKGIENRADAFMTKPFNNHELKLRVNNLLHNRRILKLRFGNHHERSSKEGDSFTDLVLKILEENYADSQFGVDDFARSLNISRGQAYKKFRTTLDKTPTNLLREFRLEKARNLLIEEDFTIAEIAYQCGFNSPEYFSTVFKDHFNQSPSSYRA